MRHFCTYFDQNYLVRGLTLYTSLTRHARPFMLWVLCFDELTFQVLSQLGLPDLRPIQLHEFEGDDKALLATKEHRSQAEYYFTCTPSWVLYLLEHFRALDSVTYLDADLFFYASPQPIFEEMGDQSVLIVGHRFPEELRDWEKYGIFNVGYLTFRNDPYGKQCLHWWRERCLEWCYDRVEHGLFADQKYLDDWPLRFQRVAVLQHEGAGVAPWNLNNYSLAVENGAVLVDSVPLLFFHFHNFKQIGRWVFDPGLAAYQVQASPLLKDHIYQPYIRTLREASHSVSGLLDGANTYLLSCRHRHPDPVSTPHVLRRMLVTFRRHLSSGKKLLQGDLWLAISGRIW